jgi:hypothetical protein
MVCLQEKAGMAMTPMNATVDQGKRIEEIAEHVKSIERQMRHLAKCAHLGECAVSFKRWDKALTGQTEAK